MLRRADAEASRNCNSFAFRDPSSSTRLWMTGYNPPMITRRIVTALFFAQLVAVAALAQSAGTAEFGRAGGDEIALPVKQPGGLSGSFGLNTSNVSRGFTATAGGAADAGPALVLRRRQPRRVPAASARCDRRKADRAPQRSPKRDSVIGRLRVVAALHGHRVEQLGLHGED